MASPGAIDNDAFHAMFIQCISERTRDLFEAHRTDRQRKRGIAAELQVDEFVNMFAAEIYEKSAPATKKVLDRAQEFTNLKAFLYVTFRAIDEREVGAVSWDDVVERVIEEHIQSTDSTSGDPAQHFAHSGTMRYDPLMESDNKYTGLAVKRLSWRSRVESRRRAQAIAEKRLQAPDDDDDIASEERFLPVEPIVSLRYAAASQRIMAFSKPRETYLINPLDFSVQGVLPVLNPTGNAVSGDIKRFEATELLATVHRDQTLKIWQVTNVPRTTNCEVNLEHEHQGSIQQISCRWYPKERDILFTGGVKGDIKQWRFSPELLADYRRGEATAHARITVGQWEPNDWHRDAVTGIDFTDTSDSIVGTCSRDATVVLYDVEKNAKSRTFYHKKGLYSLAFSTVMPSLLITGGFEFTPHVWDWGARSDRPMLLEDTKDPHLQAIISVQPFHDTPMVASCDASAKVKTWDLRMMRCLDTISLDKANTMTTVSGGNGTATQSSAAANAAASMKRHNLATDMVYVPMTGNVLVAGRALFNIESTEKADPLQAFTSPVVSIAMDPRTGDIFTAHEDCVVVWRASAGTVARVLPFVPKVPLQSSSTHVGHETIRALVIPQRGQYYWVGSSFGRVTCHKLSSGEVTRDTGRVHNHEVKSIVAGRTTHDEDYVLSVGVDGSIHCTSESGTVPSDFTLPHDIPECCVFSPAKSLMVFGTTRGQLMSVNVGIVLSKGPTSRDQAAPKGPIGAIAVMDVLNVAAVALPDGNLSFWGIKPCIICGKELAKCNIPALTSGEVQATAIAAVNVSFRGSVLIGDHFGDIHVVEVLRGIVATSTRIRRRSVKHIRTQRHFNGPVLELRAAAYGHVVFGISQENTVKFFDFSGNCTAQLCHGRGLSNIVWPGGAPPPYDFPDIDAMVGAARQRSANTIKLIHRFLSKLKASVERKRMEAQNAANLAASVTMGDANATLSAALESAASFAGGGTPSAASPGETYGPTDPLMFSTSDRHESMASGTSTPLSGPGSPRRQSSVGAGVLPPALAHFGASSVTFDGSMTAAATSLAGIGRGVEEAQQSFLVHDQTFVDDDLEEHEEAMSDWSNDSGGEFRYSHKRGRVYFPPQPPKTYGQVPRRPPTDAMLLPTSPRVDRKTGKVKPTTIIATPPKKKSAGWRSHLTLPTEARMDRVVGQLTVMKTEDTKLASKAAECSPREVFRKMDRQYAKEEGAIRRRKLLEHREPLLRYAMGKEAQEQYQAVKTELKQIHAEDKNRATAAEERRQALLRGPPMPPAPVSRRRPASARK